VGGGEADDALLQVDDDERGFGVEGGDGHGVLLDVMRGDMMRGECLGWGVV
jgi:hypothetical protein